MVKIHELIFLSLSFVLCSCGQPPTVKEEGPFWKDNDSKAIAEPAFDEPSLAWVSFKRTVPDQFLELLDIDRNIRKLLGRPVQAKNTNAFDEVPNSSWFTHRHGYPLTKMTPKQIMDGVSITPGPDTSLPWKAFRPKLGGATPGFWIEDARGDQYLIKFDPPANPEMATAAAAMGSRYFHAAGYNVPQETIVYWRKEMLQIKEGAIIKLPDGNKRELTMSDIDEILSEVHQTSDGHIRSIASLYIGNVKGPFLYDGTNSDDINDWCPHQHRRELRGLRVIASLVNHYDIKDHNSMNVYIGEKDQGYLIHFLMDFGSTFGSDGNNAKIPVKGYANLFDLRDVFVSAATIGLKSWAWEKAKPYQYPSVGYFESDLFKPEKFDPIIPNPAFEQLTDQDSYWGAKIVLAFDNLDLAALVDAGQFTDNNAAAYLLKTLIERRDKIGRHWFKKVNPLDFPQVEPTDKEIRIKFVDLWVSSGFSEFSTHKYIIRHHGKDIGSEKMAINNSIVISKTQIDKMRQEISTSDNKQDRSFFEIYVFSERDGIAWKMPVIFTLYLGESIDDTRFVKIKHPS